MSYSAGISRFHCDQVYTRYEVNSSLKLKCYDPKELTHEWSLESM